LYEKDIIVLSSWLTSLQNIPLTVLVRTIIAQRRPIEQAISTNNCELMSLFKRSFLDLRQRIKDEKPLLEKEKDLSGQREKTNQHAQACLQLIANILLILEDQQALSESIVLRIKTEILLEPLQFIVRISPLLITLLTINLEEGEISAIIKINQVILMTLQLLKIEPSQYKLQNKVINDLLILRKTLEFVDVALDDTESLTYTASL
jgi:hypothetical protein